MAGGHVRRFGAAAVLAACFVVVSGQAAADDPLPTLSINDPAPVAEGDPITFTVTLSAPAPVGGVTVRATTANDSAVEPGDYTAKTELLTIPEAATEANFTVATVEDALNENNEIFLVNLSEPSANATIDDGLGGGRITDDDDAPTVSITNATTRPEGATARFEVVLSAASSKPVVVHWGTENAGANPATPGEDKDYRAVVGGSLRFEAGETGPKQLEVTTFDDTADEDPETFGARLTGTNGNAVIGTAAGIATITDLNDPPPTVSIGDVAVTEGASGATVNAVFPVTLSAASGKTIEVSFATATATGTGAATANVDFVPANGTLVFEPGATTKNITVTVKGDADYEGNEVFVVNLFGLGATEVTPADTQGAGTIEDDDTAPAPTVADVSAAEGNSGMRDLVFEATLPGPHPQTTFSYRTVPGSAGASDYTEVGGAPLVFPAAAGPATLPVTIKVSGDTLDENDESFKLELVNPTSGEVVASAIGTITNDDNNSKLAVNDVSADEATAGETTMKFTITLTPASARAVTVSWATANGTAAADSDYTAASGSVSFAPGETAKEITVTVLGDTVNEENETLLVNLSGPGGAGITDAQGQGTIIDRNAAPSLSIDDVLTREGETATFTVTLSGNTLRTVTVVVRTIDGTAKEGTEYHTRRSVFTFAPGEKSKTFQVPGIDDSLAEPIETYFVGLEDVVNATVTKSRGTGTIDASDQVAAAGKPPTTPPTTKPDPKKPVGPARTLLPRMILGPRLVNVGANGVARMQVTCAKASPITCTGSVALETTVKPKFELGKKTFSVKKGKKVFVEIKLSARALKRLLKTGTLQARAVVVIKNSKKKNLRFVPGVVTLKASKVLQVKVPEQTLAEKAPPKKSPPKKAAEPLPEIKVEIVP